MMISFFSTINEILRIVNVSLRLYVLSTNFEGNEVLEDLDGMTPTLNSKKLNINDLKWSWTKFVKHLLLLCFSEILLL